MAQRPMPKSELLSRLSDEAGVTKKDADCVLTALFDIVSSEAKDGRSVAIPNIGKIEGKERPAGQIRNPRTGEMIHKDAYVAPKMTFSKALKDALN